MDQEFLATLKKLKQQAADADLPVLRYILSMAEMEAASPQIASRNSRSRLVSRKLQ
jgi:hypothetical protein